MLNPVSCSTEHLGVTSFNLQKCMALSFITKKLSCLFPAVAGVHPRHLDYTHKSVVKGLVAPFAA